MCGNSNSARTCSPTSELRGYHPPTNSTLPIEKPVQKTIKTTSVNVETKPTINTLKVETTGSDNPETHGSEAAPQLNDEDGSLHIQDDIVENESTETANSPVETELKPIITSVHGYNLRSTRLFEGDIDDNDDEPRPKKSKGACPGRSGPSPERLLAHANALINKVSSFVSNPPTEASNDDTVSNVEAASQKNSSSLPVEMPSSKAACKSSKSARTIQCKICIDSFGSIKELNDHHRKDHRIVDCELCDKKFANNQHWTNICISTKSFTLSVKTVVKASRSKADWSSIRLHTKQNVISCVNTKDVVAVSRTKVTSIDTCTAMKTSGSNVTLAHTKIRTRETEILI